MSSARKSSTKPNIADMHTESIDELREAFDLFDTRRAGEIPMAELMDSMQSLGFNEKNPMMFEMMLKISAKQKGGNITFTHFAEDLAHLIVDQEKDLRMVFNMLDTGNTGRISMDNLKKVAKEFGDTISDAELLEMIDTAKQADIEGSGETDEQFSNEVAFLDFYSLMTKGKSTATQSPRGTSTGNDMTTSNSVAEDTFNNRSSVYQMPSRV